MLDPQVFREIAEKITSREVPVSEAYERVIGDPGKAEARVHFYRNLYRFYLREEAIRQEYLKHLEPPESLRDRLMVVRAADWIDLGSYDRAFTLLTAGLPGLDERWLKSALFQMVRIGVRSEKHADACLEPALRLRGLLEEEFRAGRREDRITKYALCSLFITRQRIRQMSPAASSYVKRVAEGIEKEIGRVLSAEENWDAC